LFCTFEEAPVNSVPQQQMSFKILLTMQPVVNKNWFLIGKPMYDRKQKA